MFQIPDPGLENVISAQPSLKQVTARFEHQEGSVPVV